MVIMFLEKIGSCVCLIYFWYVYFVCKLWVKIYDGLGFGVN